MVNIHTIKPIDTEFIASCHGKIVAVEDHGISGGLGSAEAVAELGRGRVRRVGVTEFAESGDTEAIPRDSTGSTDSPPTTSARRPWSWWSRSCPTCASGNRRLRQSLLVRFAPDRVRAVILSLDRSGDNMPLSDHQELTGALHALPGIEVMTTDATKRTANGLMYADSFDFT